MVPLSFVVFRLQLFDLLPENQEFLLKDLDFWPSHRPAIVSNQPETLIFGFSKSKIGGSHVFTSRPTDIHEKFRKRPKNLPLCVKTPEMTPPPPVKMPIYIYTTIKGGAKKHINGRRFQEALYPQFNQLMSTVWTGTRHIPQ